MSDEASAPNKKGGRRRLKVLLIAYACEPNRGSEPGTGWNTALGLAERHEVTVATRANNREPIEAALAKRQGASPNFLYIDPPPWTLRLKAWGLMPVQLFYLFWQLAVSRRLIANGDEFDILHQITFNSFEVPPIAFLRTSGIRIWGPVGGGQQVPVGLLRAFGRFGAIKEAWRNLRVRLSSSNPWITRTLRECSMVLFANHETREILRPHAGRLLTGMMIDVGVDAAKFQPTKREHPGKAVTFLSAGRLEARKGVLLAVDSFEQLLRTQPGARLRIVGDGPEKRRIESLIARRGMNDRVTLTGAVNYDAMTHEFESADVFLFPSLRDTSGAVVLEAMAMGLPVVCLDHQGAAVMVGNDCGIRVQVGKYNVTVERFANAMESLASDPDLRRTCGIRGRKLAEEIHDWGIKSTRLDQHYQDLAAMRCIQNQLE